jgi:dTDP-glucose 4,6-dehydratase
MRAVVTGGAGFLGSHLTDRLVKEGWDVIVLDNLVTGSTDNIAHHAGSSQVRFVKQDVTEYLFVEGPVDFIFHFASPASPIDFVKMPIPVKAKNAKFMLASTSEVYGDPLVSPQPETYWGNVNPIGPRGVYDEAKRYAEAMTMAYHHFHGLDTRIVRFFNTYGPRMRLDDGRVVPNFLAQALTAKPLTIYGDGSQTRSFGYVDDIVEGVWRLANTDFHEPVNVGTQDEHTVSDFAKIVLEVTDSRSTIEYLPALPDDPKQRRPDLTRNQQVLNKWTPQVSLRDGLKRTADYFQMRLDLRANAK